MKRLKDSRVAVAMSGGVDSAVAAALMAREAGSAFGVTARLTSEYSKCCAAEDICRAADICARLGIEHHVVDLTAEFEREVIRPFMDAYVGGETPSPCVNCNRSIKFGALLDKARALGADFLATGHYARIEEVADVFYLRQGTDRAKDQTYFLARLTQEQLRHTVFPLGELHKSEVEAIAADFKLSARVSRESQDLCFVTEGTTGDWLELRSFDTRGGGEIVDTRGVTVGRHRGLHHYTIGQRKGLGVALGLPVYVVGLDTESNRLVVGTREEAMTSECCLRDLMWHSEIGADADLVCQVRYNHTPATCRVLREGDFARVIFFEPQFAITPGQLAVLYHSGRLVGSGWIIACADGCND